MTFKVGDLKKAKVALEEAIIKESEFLISKGNHGPIYTSIYQIP